MRIQIVKNGDELPKLLLPANAVKVKEPKTKMMAFLGAILSVSLYLLLATVSSWHYYRANIMDNDVNMVGQLLFVTIIVIVGIFFHELIHAVAYPHIQDVIIGVGANKCMVFCYYPKPITRMHFILMSLMPNVLLGIIPYILWLCIPAEGGILYSAFHKVAIIMIMVGSIDYINVFNVARYVPKGKKVQLSGYDTFWF